MKKLLLSLVAALSVVACTVEHIYEAPDVNVTIDNSSINNNDSNANASAEAYTYQELNAYLPIDINLDDSGYVNPDGSIGGEYPQNFEFSYSTDTYVIGEDEELGSAYNQKSLFTNLFNKAYASVPQDGELTDFTHKFPNVNETITFTRESDGEVLTADFNVRAVGTGSSTIEITLPHGRWNYQLSVEAPNTNDVQEFIYFSVDSALDTNLSPIISVGQPDVDGPGVTATALVLIVNTNQSILSIGQYNECEPSIGGQDLWDDTLTFADSSTLDVHYAYVNIGKEYTVDLPYASAENSDLCDAIAQGQTVSIEAFTHYHYDVIVSYGFADTETDIIFALGDYRYATDTFLLEVPGEQIDFTVLGVASSTLEPFEGWYWNEAGDWTHADTDWDITPVFSSNDFGSLVSLTVNGQTFTIDADNDIQTVFEDAFAIGNGVSITTTLDSPYSGNTDHNIQLIGDYGSEALNATSITIISGTQSMTRPIDHVFVTTPVPGVDQTTTLRFVGTTSDGDAFSISAGDTVTVIFHY